MTKYSFHNKPVSWLPALILFLWQAASAHQAILTQLERVNDSIKGNPENAELYIERGLLFREHRENKKALQDFYHAQQLEPGLAQSYYQIGRLLRETGDYENALTYLDKFMGFDPENLRGKKARARALEGAGKHILAADEYTELIALTGRAGPEIYTERAWALKNAGSQYYHQALKGLDEGVRKLGDLAVLHLAAVEIAKTNEDWDEALDRVDILLAGANRKERLLDIKGDLLLQAGDAKQALEIYQSAITAIDDLPVSQRNTQAMSTLRNNLYTKANGI